MSRTGDPRGQQASGEDPGQRAAPQDSTWESEGETQSASRENAGPGKGPGIGTAEDSWAAVRGAGVTASRCREGFLTWGSASQTPSELRVTAFLGTRAPQHPRWASAGGCAPRRRGNGGPTPKAGAAGGGPWARAWGPQGGQSSDPGGKSQAPRGLSRGTWTGRAPAVESGTRGRDTDNHVGKKTLFNSGKDNSLSQMSTALFEHSAALRGSRLPHCILLTLWGKHKHDPLA